MILLWLKVFHIVFVVSWFIGLLYLPRIFVYLSKTDDKNVKLCLLEMASNLARFTTIISLPGLAFGIWMFLGFDVGKKQNWMHLKLFIVLAIIAYNHICSLFLKNFKKGHNIHSHIFYRWFNEIPIIFFTLIIILVVFKPF